MVNSLSIPYWRLSGFYFWYFASLGVLMPFWSLYLKKIGFDSAQIGLLSALLVGTKMVAPNVLGWIADHSGQVLRLIRWSSWLAAMFFCGFFLDDSFGWYIGVSILFSFFWNAALPQFEALTQIHLKHAVGRYSQIRLWGSIGFIMAVLITGELLNNIPLIWLPWLIAFILFAVWMFSIITPDVNPLMEELKEVAVIDIIRQPEVIAFFVVFLLIQLAHGPYYVFFSIYLEENNYTTTVIGQLWAVGVVAEILLFVYIDKCLKVFSLRSILLVSTALGIVRWNLIAWGVGYISILLLAQILHAATFAAGHVVAIHFVRKFFGFHHQSKGQALYSSVSYGVGGMVGGLYSGYFWSSYGGKFVFGLAAASSLLACLIAWVWIGRSRLQLVV